MAYVDMFLGALSLPVYIYDVGYEFHLWTTFVGNLWTNKPILIPYMIVDTAFSQASLISAVFIACERFYAIRWPFKHRTLSTQAYRIAIFSVWALALLISAIWTGSNLLFSYKYIMFFWGPYTLILILITCGCNIGIWKKFQTGRVAASHQESRDLQNKRLTKILLIVSGLTLLAWLPLVLLNLLMYVWFFHVPRRFYHAVNLFNYLNSFVNPIFYALRIAEFRRALALCCCRFIPFSGNSFVSSYDMEPSALLFPFFIVFYSCLFSVFFIFDSPYCEITVVKGNKFRDFENRPLDTGRPLNTMPLYTCRFDCTWLSKFSLRRFKANGRRIIQPREDFNDLKRLKKKKNNTALHAHLHKHHALGKLTLLSDSCRCLSKRTPTAVTHYFSVTTVIKITIFIKRNLQEIKKNFILCNLMGDLYLQNKRLTQT
ncbi:unnamed protein product [Pocillopora meandrina]|uniref:G-protein coupled receptors family 1 profile domain-containing protein n=1 Tax=Pocillopora meandrina TaxID=46732 RepID=A0AAU9VQM5_9CNID|nr:unnamed protein product [Pocillopora meandrina]